MLFKAIEKSIVELHETPIELQNAVHEQLEKDYHEILKVVKVISFPYKDKERAATSYKAYIAYHNLMILIEWSSISNMISTDSMVIADCMVFVDYWIDLHPPFKR